MRGLASLVDAVVMRNVESADRFANPIVLSTPIVFAYGKPGRLRENTTWSRNSDVRLLAFYDAPYKLIDFEECTVPPVLQ